MKVAVITIIIVASWYSDQRIDTRTGGIRNKKTCGDHLKYGIIVIGKNTEEGPGYSKKFAVIQTPERNHRLLLGRKTLKGVINNNDG